MVNDPIPVILDVDTGVDDALALLLAVRHPALDVLAVTCVGGNTSLANVAANTLAVLALAGAPDVPVAAGMSAPLVEPARSAGYVHGANGLADLELPAHGLQVQDAHAVEVLRRTLEKAPTPVTLIALAPLTNIAVLLRMYPHVADRLAAITFMGGAIGVGNVTASAEFNVWHDPEAADIVLRSGVPTTMYGLEPFYQVTCTSEDIAALRAAPDPVPRLAGALLAQRSRVTGEIGSNGEDVVSIGDAGTVCAVIRPDAAVTRPAPMVVELAPGVSRGRTVVDLRTSAGAGRRGSAPAEGEIVTRVVTGVDAGRYRRLFLDAIS